MSIEIVPLGKYARAILGSVCVLGFIDDDVDSIGAVRIDDIQKGIAGAIVENEAGATYTILAADAFKYKRFTEAGGCAITVNAGILDEFSTTTLHTVDVGSTLIAGAGVTLNIPGGGSAPFTFIEEHSTVQLKNVGGDEFDVIGGIEGS